MAKEEEKLKIEQNRIEINGNEEDLENEHEINCVAAQLQSLASGTKSQPKHNQNYSTEQPSLTSTNLPFLNCSSTNNNNNNNWQVIPNSYQQINYNLNSNLNMNSNSNISTTNRTSNLNPIHAGKKKSITLSKLNKKLIEVSQLQNLNTKKLNSVEQEFSKLQNSVVLHDLKNKIYQQQKLLEYLNLLITSISHKNTTPTIQI
eukprot:TRINITY_DN1874_c2_g1_i1.p1 TRINITY_DN1874_c2_g1~~TRINITY_DN1874_c2_g1_i1.p1  ORF type:complete len:203 (-),score=82.98 TRINITY_DN1874_c2_g1_i1:51-659(-)